MFDEYLAKALVPSVGELTPAQKYRAEFEREQKSGKETRAPRTHRPIDIEGLVTRNLLRVAHFVRLG